MIQGNKDRLPIRAENFKLGKRYSQIDKKSKTQTEKLKYIHIFFELKWKKVTPMSDLLNEWVT